MLSDTTHHSAEFEQLRLGYQEAWERLTAVVTYWQTLTASAEVDIGAICEAERAVRTAGEEYRQARNALADHILTHSPAEHVFAASS